jgi:hypothetical protein
MSDTAVGWIFLSNWLDFQRVIGWVRPAYIKILIEIRIIILAGFSSCLKGSLETAIQNGPENLGNSVWLRSQFRGSTKLGKTKGGIGNPPFKTPRSFPASAVIAIQRWR